MSVRYNLDATHRIFQKTDRPLHIHILDNAGDGIDVETANYQWVFEVKRRPGVTPTLIVKEMGVGQMVNNGEYVDVTLNAEDLDIFGGTYWYDLYRIDADNKEVYVFGDFVVLDQ